MRIENPEGLRSSISMKNRGLVATLFAYNDLLFSLLACFMLLSVLLLVEVKNMKKADSELDSRHSGDVNVYAFWGDNLDADMDMHLESPDGEHVWFLHKDGKTWNLLRDDLGMMGDNDIHNFENASARGLPPGSYTINMAAYRAVPSLYPIEIDVEVRFTRTTAGGPKQTVYNQKVKLYRTGDETTIIRFDIDSSGNVVPGSVNHLFKQLVVPK